MDLTLLGGLATAVFGGVSLVIGALAAYQRATASRAEERGLLTIAWDVYDRKVRPEDVGRRMLDFLPARARRRMGEIVQAEHERDDEGSQRAEAVDGA
jgi:hypothetical protein